jgi:Domain of unknown function (DUF4396)
MAPAWLTVVAWTSLSICFACAAVIGYDIAVSRHRQPMAVMNAVYPITALYFGPIGLWFYWRWGRVPARGAAGMAAMHAAPAAQTAMAPAGPAAAGSGQTGQAASQAAGQAAGQVGSQIGGQAGPPPRSRPRWAMMATEVSHCGSGCVLGDVVSEFVIFWFALAIAGTMLWAEYAGDYFCALAFGIVFQYFAIAPMRGLGLRDGLVAAAKADTISLTFFEIGLFGWMAVMTFVLFPAPHLLLQIGMIIGFFTSWPANVWLIKRGIKVPM